MATPRKAPASFIDATVGFASLDAKIDAFKTDLLRELGGGIERLAEAVEKLSNGVVHGDLLEAKLKIRDERLSILEAAQVREEERSASLRLGLIVTAVAAVLGLVAACIKAVLNIP